MNGKERINTVTAVFILAATLLVDAAQILLTLTVVGSFIAFFLGLLVSFVLWLVFALHGVKYSGTGALKKLGASFGTMIVEMVPFINALPLVTIGAGIIILETKKEDREARERFAREQEQARQLTMARMQAAQHMAAVRAANDSAQLAALTEAA